MRHRVLKAPVVLLVNGQKETCVNRHLRSSPVFFGGSLSRRSRRRNITATVTPVIPATVTPPTDKNTVRMTLDLPEKKRGLGLLAFITQKQLYLGRFVGILESESRIDQLRK